MFKPILTPPQTIQPPPPTAAPQAEGPALPQGWRREEFARPNGLSNGKYHVHYINQNGQRFKSKSELARFMGGGVDLTPFDWRTGKINEHLRRKVERMQRLRACPDLSRRLRSDTSLVPPLRQTASVFKQPVTVHRTQTDEPVPVPSSNANVVTRQLQNQIKAAQNHDQQRAALAAAETKCQSNHTAKPRQIFWEKRLQGQRPVNVKDELLESFEIPRYLRSIAPDQISEESVMRSVIAALHEKKRTSTAVTGQTASRSIIAKNPAIFLDPSQPPVHRIVLEDDDIRRQEERVRKCRRELERLIKNRARS